MTLYRQLIIFTLGLFILLFSGTWYEKFESTHRFLLDQLESHAQDTATSLALSIKPYVERKDMATVESMINAIFDRGYYETIRLSDMHKKTVYERHLEIKIENVPQWFINWVPLESPENTAIMMLGWHQVGSIYVKSHPGYAYNTLWNDVTKMTIWFMVCGIIVLIVGGIGIRVLLKPLYRIELQADAICRSEYVVQEKLPWTREFLRVVQAMNRMTIKIREMFDEQVAQAKSLRERAYCDSITGLGNRRFFEGQVGSILNLEDTEERGVILLLRIRDLNEINQQRGFKAGDELLGRVAELLRESFISREGVVMARLTGGDFSVFLPGALASEGQEAAQKIADRLRQIAAEKLSLTDNVGHVGIAVFNNKITLPHLLAEADTALATAVITGPNAWHVRMIHEDAEMLPLGQQQWKDLLGNAVSEGRVTFAVQPVMKAEDIHQIIHLEILARIIGQDGETISAGTFIPFAERLKLMPGLDRNILESLMVEHAPHLMTEKVAVNISPISLRNDEFRTWLNHAINIYPISAPRIIFEFSEFFAIQNISAIEDFYQFIQKYGHRIALDHYGQSFTNFGYLKSIKPCYVKIDKAFTEELKEEGSDARFYISSLCSVAHSIDIAVVAEGVETEIQSQILKSLKVDALQGYNLERPLPISNYYKLLH